MRRPILTERAQEQAQEQAQAQVRVRVQARVLTAAVLVAATRRRCCAYVVRPQSALFPSLRLLRPRRAAA